MSSPHKASQNLLLYSDLIRDLLSFLVPFYNLIFLKKCSCSPKVVILTGVWLQLIMILVVLSVYVVSFAVEEKRKNTSRNCNPLVVIY